MAAQKKKQPLKPMKEKAVMREEMLKSIESMRKDKEAKLKNAKEQLVSELAITVDKYRTATGTAEALRCLRFCLGENGKLANDIEVANGIAHKLAGITAMMKEKAEKLEYEEMDQLCEGFYNQDLHVDDPDTLSNVMNLTIEMMIIDLCRNVGPSAEDMVEFIKRADAEIASTEKALKELDEE